MSNQSKTPWKTMSEMEENYRVYAQTATMMNLDLSHWLPSFAKGDGQNPNTRVRPLVPGEFLLLIGSTGVGKTAILQNIARSISWGTICFELELPDTLMFERFAAMEADKTCERIEKIYNGGGCVPYMDKLCHILTVSQAVSMADMERIIKQAQDDMSTPYILVVLVDYVGLVRSKGSRYERLSDVAEGLKILAKATNTIIISSSQRKRNGDDDDNEVRLHDAKDSGALENSAGVVLGLWRDPDDSKLLTVRVLKNTKGRAGLTIKCDFDGPTMRITERVEEPWAPTYSDDLGAEEARI